MGACTSHWPGLLVILCSLPWLAAVTPADSNDGSLIITASATAVRVGGNVWLRCDLRPGAVTQAENITWFRVTDGDGAQPRPIAPDAAGGVRVNGTTSTLALASVTAADGGWYRCCLGQACLSPEDIEIHVGYPPSPATDLKCDTFNFITVTCRWTRGGLSSLLPSTDTLVMSQDSQSTEGRTCTKQSLPFHCNATRCWKVCYGEVKALYYRVNTTNVLGSAVSDPLPFKLYQDGTLNPPANLTVWNVSSSNLALKWYLPEAFILEKVSDLTYIVESRYEMSTVWKSVNVDAKSDKRATVCNLTNLEPYGLYFVRVMAKLRFYDKMSDYSSIVSARTSETVPQHSPQNVHCKDSPNDNSTRSVILTWEPPVSLNGATLGYDVSYRQLGQSTDQNFRTGPNTTSSVVYGLDKHKEYVFNVRVRNSMGRSHKELCSVTALPMFLPSGQVAAIWVCVILVVAVLVAALVCIQSTRKFPNINVPTRHEDLNGRVPSSVNTFMDREAEVYDDILPPHQKLFVDLTEVPNGGPPFVNNLFLDSFDIGDKPGEFRVELPPLDFERQPLLSVAGVDGARGLVRAPLMAGRDEEEELAASRAGGVVVGDASPGSPVSVGSGGSYAHIRSGDKVVYSRLSQERLSPVILDERPAAAAPSSIDGLPTLHRRPEGSAGGEDPPKAQGFDKRAQMPLDKKHGAPQFGFAPKPDQGQSADSSTSFAIGDYSLCGLQGGAGTGDDWGRPSGAEASQAADPPQPAEEIGPYVQTTGTLPNSSQAILDSMNALPRPLPPVGREFGAASGGDDPYVDGLDYVPRGEDGFRPNRDGFGPGSGSWSTGYVPPADVMRGGGYPQEEPAAVASSNARPNEIGPYVLSTGELPPPSAVSSPSMDPFWSPASAGQVSPSSPASPASGWPLPMADEFGLAELNYATLCTDLDSEDGLGETPPGDGYATMQAAPPSTTDAGDSLSQNPAVSGYVDQNQPSCWSQPVSASQAAAESQNREGETAAMNEPTTNGLEASAISPPEDSLGNDRDRDNSAPLTPAASDYVTAPEGRMNGFQGPGPSGDGPETNGYASNSDSAIMDYVNPISLAQVPQQSPKLRGQREQDPQGSGSSGGSDPDPSSHC